MENENAIKRFIEDQTNSFDMFVEAGQFLSANLPPDFEDKFADFCREKGYNYSEQLLVRYMMVESLDFKLTVASSKAKEEEIKRLNQMEIQDETN